MNNNFSLKLRELRKEKGISQEQLAEMTGVSVQAVSKWECGQSYPDIELIPIISDIFSVSIDYLLKDSAKRESEDKRGNNSDADNIKVQDDGVLRVVQFLGNKILSIEECRGNVIKLEMPDIDFNEPLQVNIYGITEIDGDISGNVNVKDGSLTCGDVGGNVSGAEEITCGDIEGNVQIQNGSLTCGDISGNVLGATEIACGDIKGDVNCAEGRESTVTCGSIQGNVTAQEVTAAVIRGKIFKKGF